MSVWHYTAIEVDHADTGVRRGSMSAESAAEVRAALRRAGLQVVSLKPEASSRRERGGSAARGADGVANVRAGGDETFFRRWRRSRRGHDRAEVYDSLATLLDSGVPLLEAIDTLLGARFAERGAIRRMLVDVREQIRSGSTMASAVRGHPDWFDATEVAMIESSQQSGTLARTLRELAERQERSEALGHRLASALTYPAIVAVVGLGVALFLSVRILPDLTRILVDAKIEVPLLTRLVMGFGQAIVQWWIAILGGAVVAILLVGLGVRLLGRADLGARAPFDRFVPSVLRRLALAGASIRLSELIRTGVPLTDALRVLAPTVRGPVAGLGRALTRGADRLEQGQELSEALDDPRWFDAEFRRLLEVGQVGGDMDVLLDRLGRRYERSGRRLIDRLTALLEPVVIVLLAILVGLVVMSAVLPLVKLQQVV